MDKNTYIREHYLTESDEVIGLALDLSENAVRHRRRAMHLHRPVVIPERPHRELVDPVDANATKDGVMAWIIMSDMHVPYHDVRTLAAVEKFIAAHRFYGYLNIGDFMDMDSISSFNIDKPGLTEGRRISDDFAIGNEILDRHQAIIRANNPNAKFIYLEGNHEERIERFLEKLPMLKGTFSIEDGLRLRERGFEWVRSWSKGEVYYVGRAAFIHGQYTYKHHAAKMVEAYGESIFYGHTHDVNSYSKVMKGKDKVIVGQSIGCLCEHEQAYMHGKPSNWQQAFMVLYLHEDGFYTYYVPRIFNHSFVGPDGVLYSA